MARSFNELFKKVEARDSYHEERLKLKVLDSINHDMEACAVSRSELAQRMGVTRGYISKLLNGEGNMSLDTISKIYRALDRVPHFASSDKNNPRWLMVICGERSASQVRRQIIPLDRRVPYGKFAVNS